MLKIFCFQKNAYICNTEMNNKNLDTRRNINVQRK